jgi:LCP family protein required for cell wall assembly
VAVLGVVVLLLACLVGYGYWRYSQLVMPSVSGLTPVVDGQPINVLVIGSDSRAGLTGQLAAQAGAGQVTGQRSDVDMIVHLDPGAGTVQILSIPRDTMVSTGPLAATVGTFNRINTAYGIGPSALVHVIEANFGIPINHVIQVNFSGFVAATDALGGVWMNFPYPSRDAYSGLNITTPGCQHLDGTQALAVARSRHFEYEVDGQWLYDGTSDFGRIHRQGAFLRALVSAAKSQINPVSLNSFLGAIPAGVQVDSSMSFFDALDLLWHYKSLDPGTISTQTLPTIGLATDTWGDVLFVDQPAAQQMLVSIFGSQLTAPTTPPPNENLETPAPPSVATTTPSGGQGGGGSTGSSSAPTTTTTTQPSFDPSPCPAG